MSAAARLAGAALVALALWAGGARAATAPADVRAMLRAGEYPEAIEQARALVEESGSGEAWQVLADGLAEVGRYAEARDAYAKAIDVGTARDLEARVAQARIALLLGDAASGTAALQAVLDEGTKQGPGLRSPELVAVAEAARILGREDAALFQHALNLLERALIIDPDNTSAAVAIGDLLLDKYNNTEALEAYRQALEIDERYPPAILGLARSHHFDHSDTALDVARACLEIQPNYVPARVLLARLLLELGDREAARLEVERALAVNPASPEARTLAAAVELVGGDLSAFENALQSLRAELPGYVEAFVTLSEIAAQHRLYVEAVDMAVLGVALDGKLWRAHAQLGLNLLRVGEEAAARHSLEVSFRGDPYNVWVKNTLDLLDRVADYDHVVDGHFELIAPPGEARVLAPHLLPLANRAFEYYGERYGYRPNARVRIEIYPSHEDFSVRTVGLVGVDIVGVSFGPVLAFDSPSVARGSSLNWGSILWHELAHTFHLGLTANRLPRWFAEGLAVYEEHRGGPGWGGDVTPGFLQAFREGRLAPASALDRAFLRPTYPEQIVHAYYQASLLIEMIERDHGFGAIQRMMIGFRDGADTGTLLRDVLGSEPEAFDVAFDAYVRERFGHALAALYEGDGPQEKGPYPRLLEEGGAALESGDLDAAADAFGRAEALFPEYAGAGSPYHALAEIQVKRGDTAAAIGQLERLVAIDADDLDAHMRLAALYEESGDADAALGMLERALLIQPFDIALQERLAARYEAVGRWRPAVLARDAALALDPPDPIGARYRLADALAHAGELVRARREVLATLESAPLYEDALELLLRVREEAGEPAVTTRKPEETR